MNEAEQEHIDGIEHDLATAVYGRSRVPLDDIDADVLLLKQKSSCTQHKALIH